jgi:hypothetical protein
MKERSDNVAGVLSLFVPATKNPTYIKPHIDKTVERELVKDMRRLRLSVYSSPPNCISRVLTSYLREPFA